MKSMQNTENEEQAGSASEVWRPRQTFLVTVTRGWYVYCSFHTHHLPIMVQNSVSSFNRQALFSTFSPSADKFIRSKALIYSFFLISIICTASVREVRRSPEKIVRR